MRVPSRSKWIILKWFHGISWAENLSTDCCACLNWAELAMTVLGRTALVFSQKLEQIIYLAIHTHTHRYTERWRVDSRKGIAVGWKTRTLISPRRLQLTSGIKLAQFLLPICIASTHTRTHTHVWGVGQWVSGREWVVIYYNNKVNWATGIGSWGVEAENQQEIRENYLSVM